MFDKSTPLSSRSVAATSNTTLEGQQGATPPENHQEEQEEEQGQREQDDQRPCPPRPRPRPHSIGSGRQQAAGIAADAFLWQQWAPEQQLKGSSSPLTTTSAFVAATWGGGMSCSTMRAVPPSSRVPHGYHHHDITPRARQDLVLDAINSALKLLDTTSDDEEEEEEDQEFNFILPQ